MHRWILPAPSAAKVTGSRLVTVRAYSISLAADSQVRLNALATSSAAKSCRRERDANSASAAILAQAICYRAVLAQGHGSFFAVAPLKSPTGTLGSVFGYQGQPSWLFATLNRPAAQPEHYDVQLVTRDGRHLSLGETVLGGTHSTWGGQIPVKLTQVSQLRFEAASGQATMVADFSPRSPWSPG